MYFKIRKTGHKDLIVNISMADYISKLRKIIADKLGVKPENQMLIYQGKELNDNHRIVDYKIKLNDIVQLIDREFVGETGNSTKSIKEYKQIGSVKCGKPNDSKALEFQRSVTAFDEQKEIEEPCKSRYYKIGDSIDYLHNEHGSWYEGVIKAIVRVKRTHTEVSIDEMNEENLRFKIKMDITGCAHDPFTLSSSEIRPRAHRLIRKEDLQVGDVVLVNYNPDDPLEFGYWYDFVVSAVGDDNISGTVRIGNGETVLEDCKVKFVNCIMKIEETVLNTERLEVVNISYKKKCVFRCKTCKDVPRKKCKTCGCKVCHGKENPNTIVLCDDCDDGYHISCLNPPLPYLPLDPEWYCPSCKTDENEIVKAGQQLKITNKKAKTLRNKENSKVSKNWGVGMDCAGRTTVCTIVPMNHYGPVPGVEVGTSWKFRIQVSEAGVHRPPVAGIHGREEDGAYSIILSGGYEDDIDYGDEFYYTGSGGRDLEGNRKRTSEQTKDQTLTNLNKALALNCNVAFNERGSEATDWRAGKPVRVIRNYKLRKHSKYAPKEGNRYDGIYKVVKYFPVKGKSGFLVWRYFLRRDDPTPAPWHRNGLELPMQYPEGYLEAQAEKEKEQNANKGGKKRTLSTVSTKIEKKSNKKAKLTPCKLSQGTLNLIKADKNNESLWVQCKESLKNGKQQFLQTVQNIFRCVCCLDVVFLPITTPCKHNICKKCMERSFSAEIFTCPICRYRLGESYKLNTNKNLAEVLEKLLPGYENGR